MTAVPALEEAMPGLPLLDLDGEPFERGVAHGRALADLIRDNIETYLRRFESGGSPPKRERRC